jgi:ABC-type Co2+ transport system permease subunit
MNYALTTIVWRFGAAVLVGILFALLVSTILPKDHLAFPLGPGCYYMGFDQAMVQWQHCDEWRKHSDY